MTKLEDITVGSSVKGIISNSTVTIVAVQWYGNNVLEITYKDSHGQPGNQMLLRDEEINLTVMDNSLPWSFDADGEQMKLASEAYRISLAHLFDPYLAVHTSSVEPLPHQISAVYQEMLPKLPLRYVLADDPGAGKTIMTGLFIKELIARGDLKRCLIVSPGSLVEQWQDELFSKFHLTFQILTNDRMESAVTGNVFNEVDFCICRLDKLARNEQLQEKLKVSEWDLIVCDEAHKMSATIWGGEVKYTKRFQLGKLLSNITKNFLLLTATPHNGKDEDFHLFLSLVDPDRFEGIHPRYGRILACRRVSRTVMLGSAPSTSALRDQGIRGLETSRVLLGVVQPGENIADFKDALNTLHGSLSYLYNNPNGNRFWYDTKPTLRKTAEDRASQVSLADVDMEIESRLKKCRKENPFAGVHPSPTSSGDVPDDQAVRLVLLRTNDTYRRNYDNSAAMRAVQDILNNRGASPRIFRNMLAFVAPDESKIGALRQEVKRYIAWTSIMSDKEDLNLDGQQVRETENNLKRSNDTVELRLKETYCWLMVPFIDQYGDMKAIQWEISDLSGGQDSIVAKAARKMLQSDQVITRWAPALLQMTLDELLWKDTENISVKKLWEYLCTYCYLPRLSSYSVLQETICQGCASDEYFGIAAAHNGERYVGLKWNQSIFNFNNTDLLVKPSAAKAQIKKEAEAQAAAGSQATSGGTSSGFTPSGSGMHTGTSSEGAGTPGGTGAATPPTAANRHFYMSADVDAVRVNRVISTYVDEIIRHLMQVEGANVQLKLEVEVNAPDGIPSSTVRTVSENCKTLKITDFGFDD